MDSHIQRLIDDNPNINSTAISKLTGVPTRRIERNRDTAVWRYKGRGLPFVSFCNTRLSAFYCVTYKRKLIYKGNIAGSIECVDRLIFCLENNDGKLPSKVLDNMKFIGRNL
ncbi:hypothetical protein NVP1231O_48 [Vibrio phage 1.231.O._10N.261.49.F8]|nr:hypothetical protein NVP1119O_48 [Vibrio phage 1.119.O._10N.261.51.A9]AUR89642.1 hypothetical protein NVP1127O_50 [Vibrio phage 1.127.O._10N.286.52.E12]AUR90420.1 hypothetical protein NVP1143O_48 [Vibrio phage 1.143.O._10N.261.55.C8]AUR96706.1 hypothetical protein NVP1231O_48 [Vibrio phage 1.231.O._10N.261.49.F8]